MNALLEQFVIECRELVASATDDLLALETTPNDKDRVGNAFRAFHTLKGSAGIVDFAAMGRLLHAAEDILASIRAGTNEASGDRIGHCLTCLDQVARWLDEIDATGEIPAVTEAAAKALAAGMAAGEAPATAASEAMETRAGAACEVPGWVAALLARHAAEAPRARTAVRLAPNADCFFRGDDPLAVISALSGILALELAPREPWPPLEDLNPFECNLILTVLTAAPSDDPAMPRRVSGQVEIVPLEAVIAAGERSLGPEARAVLEEQAMLAENAQEDGFAGRLGSAGAVVGNILAGAGWTEVSRALSDAVERGKREGNGQAFAAALRSFLAQRSDLERGIGGPAIRVDYSASAIGYSENSTDDYEIDDPASEADDPESGIDHLASGLGDGGSGTPERQTGDIETEHGARAARPARALRVDVGRIDALVNLAGELLVARNAVGHTARLARDRADPEVLARLLKDQHALLERLVDELRRSVLGMRVLPLRHVFQNFPRLAREMARDLGKAVKLLIEGETTEADKAVVEALFEPMLHVVRNAVDHGIESEAERRRAGKSPSATVSLRAMRDGDHVIVEIADDGRGIDTAEIRRTAARRGLATPEDLARMTDEAITELIFSPGFSTAAAVTDVSGRGVGMDAVRSAIAGLGGTVAVVSRPGSGTTVRFTLPFSVMMQRVMTVEAGGQIFGIPIEAVIETTRIPHGGISRIGAAEAVVLRGRTVPLIRLTELLDLPHAPPRDLSRAPPRDLSHAPSRDPRSAAMAADSTDAGVVVATVGGQIVALRVDGFGERMDVMLKPMEGLLAGVRGFAGTTLLGDGRVLVVLDLQDLL